jgi:RecA-family ATPase
MDGFPNMDEAKAHASDRRRTAPPHPEIPPILTAAEFMAAFVPPDYIIDGIIQRGRLYALTSPTAHGKTAVALYLSCMITAGRNIGSVEVTQGAVIFLEGENPDDLRCRAHAAEQFYGIAPARMPYFLPGNFPVTADAAEQLKQSIDALGLNPVMIVFDTAAAYFHGDNDNDNVQMGGYARHLRILTGCKGNPAVVVPTHPIKAPDRDNLIPRGGGAFLNELDANLTLWSDSMGENATLHWQGKIRGADFAPVNFALTQVRIDKLKDSRPTARQRRQTAACGASRIRCSNCCAVNPAWRSG